MLDENIETLKRKTMDLINVKNIFIAILFLSWSPWIKAQTAIEFYHIANEQREQKAFQKALEYYNESLTRNPNLANAYAERGYCFSNLGQYKQTLADYNKAIELGLEDKLVYLNRGWTYYNLGVKEKACVDWKKAEELGYKAIKKDLQKYCESKPLAENTDSNPIE
jgi:tetratricopeptide (TPR) repeat protein